MSTPLFVNWSPCSPSISLVFGPPLYCLAFLSGFPQFCAMEILFPCNSSRVYPIFLKLTSFSSARCYLSTRIRVTFVRLLVRVHDPRAFFRGDFSRKSLNFTLLSVFLFPLFLSIGFHSLAGFSSHFCFWLSCCEVRDFNDFSQTRVLLYSRNIFQILDYFYITTSFAYYLLF